MSNVTNARYIPRTEVKSHSKFHFYFRTIVIALILAVIGITYLLIQTNASVETATRMIENDVRSEYESRYEINRRLLEFDYDLRLQQERMDAYAILGEAEDTIAELQAQLEIKRAKEAQLASIQLNSSPYTVTNLTGEQFNEIINALFAKYGISSSENLLYNCGNALAEIEKVYGVNGLFVMAISWMESGSRTSDLARKYNNMTSIYGGDGLNTYSNPSECIINTGRILRNNYYDAWGCRNAADIGTIYCPPNPNWANSVTGFCKTIIRVAENLY